MADITLTASRVSPVNETEYVAWTLLAGAAITRGQTVAIDTNGKAVLADGSTSAQNNVRGIALNAAGAGDPVTIMVMGSLYGFDLASVAYDAVLYQSNTAGALNDSAGGSDVDVVVGRVRPMHDGATPTKVLFVNIPAIM